MDKPSPLGFGLGLRPLYYKSILDEKPRVDWFEVISENYMVPGGRPLAILSAFARITPSSCTVCPCRWPRLIRSISNIYAL